MRRVESLGPLPQCHEHLLGDVAGVRSTDHAHGDPVHQWAVLVVGDFQGRVVTRSDAGDEFSLPEDRPFGHRPRDYRVSLG